MQRGITKLTDKNIPYGLCESASLKYGLLNDTSDKIIDGSAKKIAINAAGFTWPTNDATPDI